MIFPNAICVLESALNKFPTLMLFNESFSDPHILCKSPAKIQNKNIIPHESV
jgi:hypothetical protein